MAPRFISVTYAAVGITRDLTRDVFTTLHKSSGLRAAAHLTCVDASREETLEIASSFFAAGVADIVALHGDPAKGQTRFRPHPEGFKSSVELISALAKTGDFTLRVGAYPETDPEAKTASADIEFLKRKIDAGASEALTQFFFEAKTYLSFRDACEKIRHSRADYTWHFAD